MADRVPLPPISGLLSGFVSVDVFAGYFSTAQTLTAFQPAVIVAPSGGSVSVDLRTATGGGGLGLSATIPDGAKVPATPVSGSIAIAADSSLYIRVTAESGSALTLYGNYEIESGILAATALTTLARVKAYKGITAAASDAIINTLISGVSVKMQEWMRAAIIQQLIVAEIHDAGGLSDILILDEPPVITPPAVVLRLNGTVVDATTYETDNAAAELIQVTSGVGTVWTAGRRAYSVDYTSGYTAVPEDLAVWATKQVVHEFLQTGSAGRLSLRGEIIDEAGSGQYMIGEWVPGIEHVMEPYKNHRYF